MTATTTTALEAKGLTVRIDGKEILHGISAAVPSGKITAIVGPNGSGKSTLLRSWSRLQRYAGHATVNGDEISRVKPKDFARRVALLPQSPLAPEGLTVEGLVSRGRDPHRRWWEPWRESDREIVAHALELTDLSELAGRELDSLSGGQRQRAWIALALAQSTGIVLLDEPTNFLDITFKLEVMDTVKRLNEDTGLTVAMVLHDLDLAARYADKIIVVNNGEIAAEGSPADVITELILGEVFAVEASLLTDPRSGSPVIAPYRPLRSRH